MKYFVIAIVGPSGTNKSIIGFKTAVLLDYRFIDAGLIWRLFAAKLIQRGISPTDEAACLEVAQVLDITGIGVEWISDSAAIWFRSHLSVPGVVALASQLAENPQMKMRVALVIRDLYTPPGVVIVGRPWIYHDVFPMAYYRALLHANQYARAGRNRDGETVDKMIERDLQDGIGPGGGTTAPTPGHHATLSAVEHTTDWLAETFADTSRPYRRIAEDRYGVLANK